MAFGVEVNATDEDSVKSVVSAIVEMVGGIDNVSLPLVALEELRDMHGDLY